jgi:hypothetical protein
MEGVGAVNEPAERGEEGAVIGVVAGHCGSHAGVEVVGRDFALEPLPHPALDVGKSA